MLLAAKLTSKGSPSTAFAPSNRSSLTANTLALTAKDWVVRSGAGSLLTTLNCAEASTFASVDTATVKVIVASASTTSGNSSSKVNGEAMSNASRVKGALPAFETSTPNVASDNMGTSPNTTSDVTKSKSGPTTSPSSPWVVGPNSRRRPHQQTVLNGKRGRTVGVFGFKIQGPLPALPQWKGGGVRQAEQDDPQHTWLHVLHHGLQIPRKRWRRRRVQKFQPIRIVMDVPLTGSQRI